MTLETAPTWRMSWPEPAARALPETLHDEVTDEERLRWARAIAEAARAASHVPQPELTDAFRRLGAPAGDLDVTAMSARAGLLGMAHGRAFCAHELRGRLPMPPELEPEVAVWAEQQTVPTWVDAVWTEPKYFSFFQDAPLPTHNPNHRRKWRAHELLHGAVGSFWHPEMSRFEFTLGARLNELLPVVHWYGLDEMFRPRCPRHAGQVLHREYCQLCEDAATPYWTTPHPEDDPALADAIRHAAHALAHFNSEWRACAQELETGRLHPTPRPGLDASSDAIGYLKGHWNRCTAWSFGAFVEHFLRVGEDYCDTIESLHARVADQLDALVLRPLEVHAARFERLRVRRALQDLGYRTLLTLEWFGEDGGDASDMAEDALWPLIEDLATIADRLLADEDAIADAREVTEALELTARPHLDALPAPVRDGFWRLGHDLLLPTRRRGASQVRAGLLSAQSATASFVADAAAADSDGLDALLGEFAESAEIDTHGRLIERFVRWMDAHHPTHAMTPGLRLDAWLISEPRRDDEADLFAALPETIEALGHLPGRLRLRDTVRGDVWSPALIAELFGEEVLPGPIEADEEEVTLLVALVRDEVRLILPTPDHLDVLAAVEADDRAAAIARADALAQLLDEGFVVWLPAPYRSRDISA